MENASACESGGIARPGGAILGACTNTSACAGIAMPGGAILGAEVGGGANVLCCAMYGVTVVVVVLHVGRACCFCTVSGLGLLCHVGVGVGVVALCGCRGHGRCAVWVLPCCSYTRTACVK